MLSPVEEREEALVDAVRQAMAKGDVPGVRKLLGELCCVRTDESQPLLRLIVSLIRPPPQLEWLAVCEQVLFEAMAGPVCNAAAADGWIRAVVTRQDVEGDLRARIDTMLKTDPLRGRRAADGLVWNLYYTGREAQIWPYVTRREAVFRSDHTLWASVGKALSDSQQHHEAVKWYKGWQKRGDVTPEDLSCLAGSLRRLGDLRKAQEVSRAALDLPVKEGLHHHHMWLAVDAMNAGDIAALKHHMAAAEGQCANPYDYAAVQQRALALYLRALAEPGSTAALLAKLDELQRYYTEIHALDCPITRRLYADVRRVLAAGR